jgi:hypothetical protein
MTKTASSTTAFGTPTRGQRVRSAQGRACAHPGCSTVLSVYNASATCWLHTGPDLKHPLAKS